MRQINNVCFWLNKLKTRKKVGKLWPVRGKAVILQPISRQHGAIPRWSCRCRHVLLKLRRAGYDAESRPSSVGRHRTRDGEPSCKVLYRIPFCEKRRLQASCPAQRIGSVMPAKSKLVTIQLFTTQNCQIHHVESLSNHRKEGDYG